VDSVGWARKYIPGVALSGLPACPLDDGARADITLLLLLIKYWSVVNRSE
jgi:hypothetical protein